MEANSESRVYEQETMQHSDVEASVQDTVEPVRKMSQMRQLVMDYGTSQQAAQFFKTFGGRYQATAFAGVERSGDVRYGFMPLVGNVPACGIQPPACVE